MKLYVDDIREAPQGWTLARTISDAVTLIRNYSEEITEVSLDHDISIPVKVEGKLYNRPSPDTFKVVAHVCAMQWYGLSKAPRFYTHSSNPEGRQAIVNILSYAGHACEERPSEQAFRVNDDGGIPPEGK